MTKRKRPTGENTPGDTPDSERGAKVAKKSKREVAKPYEPTPRERAAVDGNLAKKKEKLPPPVLGTTDSDFLFGLLYQLSDAGSKNGEVHDVAVNFMVSVVKGVEPKDQVEAMLAAQMAAVHMQAMTFSRKLTNAEYLSQQDSAERAFNKLTRTFAAQVEALKRYRTGGQQKVTVEHVTVNEGGQAIVGNVAQGGRGSGKK